jgi:hypothetical protein
MEDQKCLKKPFDIQSSYTEIHELVDHHRPSLLAWNSLLKKSKTEKDTQHLRYDPTKNTQI